MTGAPDDLNVALDGLHEDGGYIMDASAIMVSGL